MAERMTPEREAEIRRWLSAGENAHPSCGACNEHVLLSEVDALRADRDAARAQAAGAMALVQAMRESETSAADVLVAIINCRDKGVEKGLGDLLIRADRAVSRSKEAYWSNLDVSDRAAALGAAVEGMARALEAQRTAEFHMTAACCGYGFGPTCSEYGALVVSAMNLRTDALTAYREAVGGGREGEK